MLVSTGNPNHHWNYFIAIEEDLEKLSRYIEPSLENENTYSIELAHLLLSASSEVDVVLKQICDLLGASGCDNINQYREVIANCPIGQTFINEMIVLSRFGLSYKPFENWNNDTNPDWWRDYNKVKHVRNVNFHKANLKNVLNAVGALLISVIYYYKLEFSRQDGKDVSFRDVIVKLNPMSSIMKISGEEFTIGIFRVF